MNGAGGQNKQGSQNFKSSFNNGNEWKKKHKCLILMLNLKVDKQTGSKASKNKVIVKEYRTYQWPK